MEYYNVRHCVSTTIFYLTSCMTFDLLRNSKKQEKNKKLVINLKYKCKQRVNLYAFV